jgi:hypothetical protein
MALFPTLPVNAQHRDRRIGASPSIMQIHQPIQTGGGFGGMHGGFGGGGMHFGGGSFGGGGTRFGGGGFAGGGFRGGMVTGRSVFVPGGNRFAAAPFAGGGMRFGGGGLPGGMVTGRSVSVPGGNRFAAASFAGQRFAGNKFNNFGFRNRFNNFALRNRFFFRHHHFRNFVFFGAPFFEYGAWPYDYDYAAYGGCWRAQSYPTLRPPRGAVPLLDGCSGMSGYPLSSGQNIRGPKRGNSGHTPVSARNAVLSGVQKVNPRMAASRVWLSRLPCSCRA